MGARALFAVLGGVGLLGGSAGVANAVPPEPPTPPCSFVMSAPVRAADAVSAAVESTGCALLAAPYSSVVCLQAPGAPIQCAQARGSDPARISVPYTPGVFVASGRGCAGLVGLPPSSGCQTLGPDAVTL